MICDFSNVRIRELGLNKVLVKGAKGYPPTKHYKNSATYMDGYRSIGTLVIAGKDALQKGKLLPAQLLKSVLLFLEKRS